MNYFVVISLLMLSASVNLSVQENSDQDSPSSKFDGEFLLQMGRIYNKPLLRLLGKTIRNVEKKIECFSGGCDQWSEWSSCSAEFGQFGMKERTRECSVYAPNCGELVSNETETDSRLCERTCPQTYNLTKNGFCLKYVTSKVSKTAAETACQADGGHVVNVNSPEKMDDIVQITGAYAEMWTDGKRTSSTSPWEFSYQSDLTWSPEWMSGYPNSGSNFLCLGVSNKKTRFNYSCSTGFKYICEIV